MKKDFMNSAFNHEQGVIPAKAGIQRKTGCRIKSGMTAKLSKSIG
jgi:hypothetical protein